MNRTMEAVAAVLTIASIIVILADYLLRLSEAQKLIIYMFDFVVVVILAVDFYTRFRRSKQGLKFVLKNWYEILAMVPLIPLCCYRAAYKH